MLRSLLAVILFVLTLPLFADTTPYAVALLVHEDDPVPALTEAIASDAPLTRAIAARVIAIRGFAQLLPELRAAATNEKDATAAREEIRALALLGSEDDLTAAVAVSSKWPSGMDDALAAAAARRGGVAAIRNYSSVLSKTRMNNAAEFFRIALWGQPSLMALAGARTIGNGDERGWRGLLDALLDSNMAMDGAMLTTALGSPAEDIRSATVWYLIRGYALEPVTIHELVKQRLSEPRAELSSDREDFGLELLRRMLGGEPRDDARWQKFLQTEEADHLFAVGDAALQYLTESEYALRYARCEIQTRECAMPRTRSKRTIPSQPVAPPAFNLPSALPEGLSAAILTGARCSDSWIGVATATIDRAGRLKSVDLSRVAANPACRRALETVLQLSVATNTSIRSAFTAPVVLVHAARTPLCLDESIPEASAMSTFRAGGAVEAPKVLKRVEPVFPRSTREAMGGQRHVIVVVEAVISKDGCVRSLRLVEQSPFPELNGAALMALAQWKFRPGYLDGKAVDVLFNLVINFKTG